MGQRVLVFGASGAWGAWDDEYHGWVTRLELLFDKESDTSIEFVNCGVSGDNSNDLVKRINPECKARLCTKWDKAFYKDNIVMIDIGKNDTAYENGKQIVPPKKFGKNLQKMIKIARKYAKKIVFLSCMTVDESQTVPYDKPLNISYYNKDLKKYSEIIKSICEKNNALFIDVFTPFEKLKTNLMDDGLHPNAQGHKLLAEIVEKTLKKSGYLQK